MKNKKKSNSRRRIGTSHELLDGDKQRKLAERAAKGNEEAKKELFEKNLRLAAHWANKENYMGEEEDFYDLYQEASIGLMRIRRRTHLHSKVLCEKFIS